MRVNAGLAVLAGLALRVFFVLKFPVTDSGDAPFYIELAWNWLKNGVYGFAVSGRLTPVDMRVPGYPAFLAAVFAFAGNSPRAVMLAQAVLDLASCFLIALIASRLAPEAARRRVALAGLWLAAFCPFTANYTAVVLTETLTIFLTTLAILILLETELGRKISDVRDGGFARGLLNRWLLAGIVVGFGTLVRPETPLLLFAAGLALAIKWWRPANWLKLLRAGLLLAVGVAMSLIPWAARNWRTLHDIQFLAPRYSELPGEYTPLGFNEWTNTWLWHFRDVYLTQWKLNVEEISVDDIPPTAFDSSAERERISDLLDQYNEELTVGPALDRQFREVAQERTLRHPLRTYLKIPFLRALTLWVTPRLELLPYSGHLRPVRVEWEDDRPDFLVTLTLIIVNFVYLALALMGAWMARREPGVAFLIAFIIIRTSFFTTFVESPEPRYVLECFPAVIALAAQVFAGRAFAARRLN
ncbi:MAG: glycosyltransferase family 39 protein [Candidatus Acidiferrales bacterium]